jgi:zinc protease
LPQTITFVTIAFSALLRLPRIWARNGGAFLALGFLSLLPVLPAQGFPVERVTSASGIEAWLVQDHSLPIVTLRFSFRGGASTDPEDKTGLATMTAGLLDEGAGTLDSQSFQGREEDLSATIEFAARQDALDGSLRVTRNNLDAASELLRLALTAPRFDPEPVARVRSEILTMIARRAENPEQTSNRIWWQNAFGRHPYGRPNDGTVKGVDAITVDDLLGFVRNRLARDVLIVGVVGDVTPEDTKALVDRIFGALPEKAAPVTVPEVKAEGGNAVLLVHKDVPQSVAVFGQNGLKRDDPDWYAAYVMNYILGGGGFSSRLTNEIREKRGLAYSVYTFLDPLDHAGVLLGSLATRNAKLTDSIALVRSEWARMRDQGPTEEELAAAKTYLTGSFPLQFDSTGNIAMMLVQIQEEHLGIDYLDRRNALINAVTLADVRRVVKRMLDPDALSFVIFGQPDGLKPTREVAAAE